MHDTHSATISVDDNQLKCCCDQSVQLKQLRLVNLRENESQLTFKAPLLNVDLQWTYCIKTVNVSIDCVVIQYLISWWEKNMLLFVEKPQFSIGLISSCPDQFNSCALLKSKIPCLHVSFTTYEYFYKLSKNASFSRWLLHPVTQKNQ